MYDISIVIPAYNEQESLKELNQRIKNAIAPTGMTYEVIFIDDGSTDNTFEEVRNLKKDDANIKGLCFLNNRGKAAALAAGFNKASGKYVITMDADLQDDPAEIPSLIEKLKEGYDMVSGWKKKRHDPITKRLPSKLFNFVTSIVSGIKLHDFNCGLKAYKVQVVKSISIYGELHRYIPALAHWGGYKVTEKVVEHHPRKHGKSKYGFGRIFSYFDLLSIVFLNRYLKRPLHFFGFLGSLLLIAGGGILGYFGYQWLITGEMHVRPLILLAVTMIILSFQFISLGLLGEMITYSGRKEDIFIDEEV